MTPALEMSTKGEYTDSMSRQMRIEFPGALYHVTARGNCKSDIFIDDIDRFRFLDALSSTVKQYNLLCHAYCVMTNHYHLIIETPDANLSASMHRLNTIYAHYFNWKHDRIGHLFQGRFNAIVVQKESHLLELCRYIVLNPVRARIVSDPSQYDWSSFRETISSSDRSGSFLTKDWILSQFDPDMHLAKKKYINFVLEGIDSESPMNDVKGDLVLGDVHFVEQLKKHVRTGLDDAEIPAEQRQLFIKRLEDMFGDIRSLNKEMRNNLILEACKQLGYTQIEVSTYLGLNRRTIARIVAHADPVCN